MMKHSTDEVLAKSLQDLRVVEKSDQILTKCNSSVEFVLPPSGDCEKPVVVSDCPMNSDLNQSDDDSDSDLILNPRDNAAHSEDDNCSFVSDCENESIPNDSLTISIQDQNDKSDDNTKHNREGTTPDSCSTALESSNQVITSDFNSAIETPSSCTDSTIFLTKNVNNGNSLDSHISDYINQMSDGSAVVQDEHSESNEPSVDSILKEDVDENKMNEDIEDTFEQPNADPASNFSRPPKKKLDPSVVPRATRYFMHDMRDEGEDNPADGDHDGDLFRKSDKPSKSDGVWKHDMFDAEMQVPRSPGELLSMYGYEKIGDAPQDFAQSETKSSNTYRGRRQHNYRNTQNHQRYHKNGFKGSTKPEPIDRYDSNDYAKHENESNNPHRSGYNTHNSDHRYESHQEDRSYNKSNNPHRSGYNTHNSDHRYESHQEDRSYNKSNNPHRSGYNTHNSDHRYESHQEDRSYNKSNNPHRSGYNTHNSDHRYESHQEDRSYNKSNNPHRSGYNTHNSDHRYESHQEDRSYNKSNNPHRSGYNTHNSDHRYESHQEDRSYNKSNNPHRSGYNTHNSDHRYESHQEDRIEGESQVPFRHNQNSDYHRHNNRGDGYRSGRGTFTIVQHIPQQRVDNRRFNSGHNVVVDRHQSQTYPKSPKAFNESSDQHNNFPSDPTLDSNDGHSIKSPYKTDTESLKLNSSRAPQRYSAHRKIASTESAPTKPHLANDEYIEIDSPSKHLSPRKTTSHNNSRAMPPPPSAQSRKPGYFSNPSSPAKAATAASANAPPPLVTVFSNVLPHHTTPVIDQQAIINDPTANIYYPAHPHQYAAPVAYTAYSMPVTLAMPQIYQSTTLPLQSYDEVGAAAIPIGAATAYQPVDQAVAAAAAVNQMCLDWTMSQQHSQGACPSEGNSDMAPAPL